MIPTVVLLRPNILSQQWKIMFIMIETTFSEHFSKDEGSLVGNQRLSGRDRRVATGVRGDGPPQMPCHCANWISPLIVLFEWK